MNPRIRSRMPASIGSNQASPVNKVAACVVVLSSPMAWSPPARQRRSWLVEQAGDYATFQFHHLRDGTGRGRRGHTPFIIAVETTADRRPLYARLQVVRGFQTTETKRLCARGEPGTTIVSDGGQWFQCIAWQPGLIHERHVTGSDRTAARHPAFRWANTVLANVKNSLLATHRAVAAKHLPRYLHRVF